MGWKRKLATLKGKIKGSNIGLKLFHKCQGNYIINSWFAARRKKKKHGYLLCSFILERKAGDKPFLCFL